MYSLILLLVMYVVKGLEHKITWYISTVQDDIDLLRLKKSRVNEINEESETNTAARNLPRFNRRFEIKLHIFNVSCLHKNRNDKRRRTGFRSSYKWQRASRNDITVARCYYKSSIMKIYLAKLNLKKLYFKLNIAKNK